MSPARWRVVESRSGPALGSCQLQTGRHAVSPRTLPIVFLSPSESSADILTETLHGAFLWVPGRPGIWQGEQPRPGLYAPLDGNVGPWVPAPDPERAVALGHRPQLQQDREHRGGPRRGSPRQPSPGSCPRLRVGFNGGKVKGARVPPGTRRGTCGREGECEFCLCLITGERE